MLKVNKKGFTLIELLVVVAVIGILASVILIGLAGFRGRGRDARRIGDLRQVQNGLELYFNSTGEYPVNGTWAALTTELTGAGIGVNQVPDDPGTGAYFYATNSDRNRYVLGATLEEANTALADDLDGVQADFNSVDCGVAATDEIYCTTI